MEACYAYSRWLPLTEIAAVQVVWWHRAGLVKMGRTQTHIHAPADSGLETRCMWRIWLSRPVIPRQVRHQEITSRAGPVPRSRSQLCPPGAQITFPGSRSSEVKLAARRRFHDNKLPFPPAPLSTGDMTRSWRCRQRRFGLIRRANGGGRGVCHIRLERHSTS